MSSPVPWIASGQAASPHVSAGFSRLETNLSLVFEAGASFRFAPRLVKLAPCHALAQRRRWRPENLQKIAAQPYATETGGNMKLDKMHDVEEESGRAARKEKDKRKVPFV